MTMRMPFGAHKGQPLHLLPDDYLEWLLSIELREPLREGVLKEWHTRRNPANADPVTARALIDKGYRQLAKKAHPDCGGTTVAMQRLNRTMEWLRRQLELLRSAY